MQGSPGIGKPSQNVLRFEIGSGIGRARMHLSTAAPTRV
jgi:hypothetical protein